ncbi:MAG: prenyltransferase [Dehalococcoidia bacterium]|jgi:1,4-dihydroxy-2-naphthoate octaprenyltransferase
MNLKVWFAETRPQFLLLSVVLAFLGAAIAWYDSLGTTRFSFHWGHALLAALGLLLCHISVNVLNDYFDYKSGIDIRTQRTPFSGGSGVLPAALLKPRQVLWLGLGSLILAVPIGVYFVLTAGWALLPLLVVAALCTVLYTPLFTRMGWPEWAPGVGLGALPVLGAYFIQSGFYTAPAVIAAIPSGILVHNLLLINEFPDIPADREAGRRTLPIAIGKKGAWLVYSLMTAATYLWIIAWVIAGAMPVFTLIALLTIPLAVKAIAGGRHYDDMSKLVPALAANIMVVLLTQLLLGVGYILAGVF